jgi:predicted nucleotidyltransferase
MSTQRYAQLTQALDKILKTLIAQYQPEKIILFGSMATGKVSEWSDIDLAILKDTAKLFVERSAKVAVLCLAPVGVDYLVYTPAEFQQMIQEDNPFIVKEIVNKGKILYERKPFPAMT